MSKGLDINRIVSVTGNALNKTSELLSPNHTSDKALRYYEKLEPDHFKQLSSKYGERTVERYIKEMEARKMGVK